MNSEQIVSEQSVQLFRKLIWRSLLLSLKFQSSNFDPPPSVPESQSVNILIPLISLSKLFDSDFFLIYPFLQPIIFSEIVSGISQTKSE